MGKSSTTILAEAFRDEGGSLSGDSHLAQTAVEFSHQAEKLSLKHPQQGGQPESVAVEALFITPLDPVIVTGDGNRLPSVPVKEAHKLNILKHKLHGDTAEGAAAEEADEDAERVEKEALLANEVPSDHGRANGNGGLFRRSNKGEGECEGEGEGEGTLRRVMPPSHTHPLFPPLPLYGPPTLLRKFQCFLFRVSSHILGLLFLAVIVLGACFTSIGPALSRVRQRLLLHDPNEERPFYREEMRRARFRKAQDESWVRNKRGNMAGIGENKGSKQDRYQPTEGGPDPIVCDVGYYARRVGLDVEVIRVLTEDGFIIQLWHVFDPQEYTKLPLSERGPGSPGLPTEPRKRPVATDRPKFPVLLMHGLLQSSGAYCCSDEDSLAFYLCKSGYDVWLGNNRCGFHPEHSVLNVTDPRMWCWNIRQMGVMDLPALVARVRFETGFAKIGLICHSQGTTEALVALAKEQRPDLGEQLTVFCGLAPAVYAGPLIGKMYFKFMRVISPALFRIMFGIHAFLPIMMTAHRQLPPRVYGFIGYLVFWFLFGWSDTRWDRGLRNRMFQFAPVYVSTESMRWWLGRECFAKHKCILSTREVVRAEEQEDTLFHELAAKQMANGGSERPPTRPRRRSRGATAWYNEKVPPFAFWIAGNDKLVDGEKLLRRFERGREPYVRLIHHKVIPKYEHLDVLWAMDAVILVFCEIREILWKTCDARDICRVPTGCEDVPAWDPSLGRRRDKPSEEPDKLSNMTRLPAEEEDENSGASSSGCEEKM